MIYCQRKGEIKVKIEDSLKTEVLGNPGSSTYLLNDLGQIT